jgi:hypothetical protein
MRRRREGKKGKETKRKIKIKNGKGIIDISPSYPHYTAMRSCFAKYFSKTVSVLPQNPLYHHSHSRSCHNRS